MTSAARASPSPACARRTSAGLGSAIYPPAPLMGRGMQLGCCGPQQPDAVRRLIEHETILHEGAAWNPRRHRSSGVVLVVLGVLLLAANAGVLRFIDWNVLWPLIFIGLGLALLARQADWRR